MNEVTFCQGAAATSVLDEAFDRWAERMALPSEDRVVAYANFTAGWTAAYGDAMTAALRFAGGGQCLPKTETVAPTARTASSANTPSPE